MSGDLEPDRLESELSKVRAEPETADRLDRLVLLGQAAVESMNLRLRALGREVLEEAAAAGSPQGMWLCAYAVLEGRGGSADIDRGLALLADAARAGVTDAAFELGQLLARSGQKHQAMPWLGAAAEAGHPGALRMLGRMAAGSGDHELGLKLLSAAIESGSNQAIYDRLLLYAQRGPTEELLQRLDPLLRKRAVPAGVLAEVGRATAVRDPDALISLAIAVTAQGKAARQAFLDGLRRGNASLYEELGADLQQVLEL